jgi:hypothetical protein
VGGCAKVHHFTQESEDFSVKTDAPQSSLQEDDPSQDMHLNLGERVLFRTRYSIIKFVPRWFTTLAICALTISIAGHAQMNGAARGWSSALIHGVSAMAAAMGIASFLVFLFAFLLYRHQWLILTDSRLTQTWIWNLNSQNWVLRNITNIDKRRSLLGLIFGYGTIQIHDADGGITVFRFVPKVDQLESALAQASSMQLASPSSRRNP